MTDWLMVVITFVYVIATLIICIYNKKSVDAVKAQTEEFARQFNEQNRPHITVYFDLLRSRILCLCIENDGNKSAHDVNININDEFISNINDENIKAHLEEFKKDKINLACKQKVYVLLGNINEFDNISRCPLNIEVSYDNYIEYTKMDLKQYKTLIAYGSPLDDIVTSIDKLSNKIK